LTEAEIRAAAAAVSSRRWMMRQHTPLKKFQVQSAQPQVEPFFCCVSCMHACMIE